MNEINLFFLFYIITFIGLVYLTFSNHINQGIGAFAIIILVLPFVISIKKFKQGGVKDV